MSSINTAEARKHWSKNGKDECDYLDMIEFVAHEEVDGETMLSLPKDEEANDLTILTTKAARHVAEQLLDAARIADLKNIRRMQARLLKDSPHNINLVEMWDKIAEKLEAGKKIGVFEQKKIYANTRQDLARNKPRLVAPPMPGHKPVQDIEVKDAYIRWKDNAKQHSWTGLRLDDHRVLMKHKTGTSKVFNETTRKVEELQ